MPETRSGCGSPGICTTCWPTTSRWSAAAALRTELPSVRVAILTTFGRPGYLRRAMEAGALGFVVKDAPAA